MDKIRWYVGYGVLVFGLFAIGIAQYGSAEPATIFASLTSEGIPASPASEPEDELDAAATEAAVAAPQTLAALNEAVATTTALQTQPADVDAVPTDTTTVDGGGVPMHQDEEGVLHGVVNGIDLDGKLFPAPNVLIKALKDSRLIEETRSDRDGTFKFERLVPGGYLFDARGPAGTATRSVPVAPIGGSAFSPLPLVLTPFGNSGALSRSGGQASFIPSRRSSGGGGGSSAGAAPSGDSGGGNSGSGAALAGLASGLAAGSGGGGSGSGGGSGGAVPVVTPGDNVSDFEP